VSIPTLGQEDPADGVQLTRSAMLKEQLEPTLARLGRMYLNQNGVSIPLHREYAHLALLQLKVKLSLFQPSELNFFRSKTWRRWLH
jgi:hypothetical protein